MATIQSVLLKSNKNKEGKCPVSIRVTSKSTRLHLPTGFFASEEEFVEGKNAGRYKQGTGIPKFTVQRKESGKIAAYTNREANNTLAELENKVSRAIADFEESGKLWTMEMLKDVILNEARRSLFYQYALDVIDTEYISKGAFKRAAIVKDALQSFKKYDPKFEKKEFQDITAKYIQGYINNRTKAGNALSTINLRLREIRRIFNIAIRDGLTTQDYYPFSTGRGDGVKLKKAEITKAENYLTKESLEKMANTKMRKKVHEKVKHLFLFSFYCRGINWKDMALLTTDNLKRLTITDETTKESREETVIQYSRSKTNGSYQIIVTPVIDNELQWFKKNTRLLGNHLLPIIQENVAEEHLDIYLQQSRKRFNRQLREIAEILEFPESQRNITFYTGRHSFAMYLQNENKPVEIISQALGHQSVETTKHYLAKFSTTKMAEETFIDLSKNEETP